MVPGSSRVFQLAALVFALRTRQTRRVLLPYQNLFMYTHRRWKALFSIFCAVPCIPKDKVRGEGNCAGANGGFANGCPM